MRNFDIKFRGVDDFNRPVFKVVDKAIYFGSTNILVPDKDRFPKGTKEYRQTSSRSLDLVYRRVG